MQLLTSHKRSRRPALPTSRLACKQLGFSDRALQALEGVLQLAPAHAEAMLLMADIYDEVRP